MNQSCIVSLHSLSFGIERNQLLDKSQKLRSIPRILIVYLLQRGNTDLPNDAAINPYRLFHKVARFMSSFMQHSRDTVS